MAKKTLPPIEKSESAKNLLQQGEYIKKSAIENGDIIDPEVKAKYEGERPREAEGIEKEYNYLPGDYYDKYEDYINPHTLHGRSLSLDEMKQLRFENQTFGQEIGHGLGRIATNVIPSIIGGFASMVDIPGYFSAEEAANNSIVNWADDWKKRTDEEWLPIYTDPKGDTLDLTSSAWWASRGSGLVESVLSFVVQGAGVGKGVSLIGKGLGSAMKGKTLFNALSKVPGVTSGAEAYAGLAKGTQTLTTATMLNQSEAVIEATQVYKDTYDTKLSKGYSVDEAKQSAADAAATTMSLNRINILLNLSSAGAFLKPFKHSRNLLKETTKAGLVGEVIKEGGQESLEEAINHVASQAGKATGEGKKYTWEDLKKDVTSGEAMEAMFLGAIGGVAQTGGTKLVNGKKTKLEREEYEAQQKIINEMQESGVKTSEALMNLADQQIFQTKLRKAAVEGNQAEYDKLKEQHLENQAVKAFKSGTTEVLEKMYEAEAQRPVEEVGQEYIDNAKNAIEKIKKLESIYNNFEEYENVNDIFHNQVAVQRNQEAHKLINQELRRNEVNLGEDVRRIAGKYNYTLENDVLIKKDGTESTERISREVPLTYSLSEIENNTQIDEKNKETYDKFLKEVQSLPSYEAHKEYQKDLETTNETLLELGKEFKELTSPQAQEKALNERVNTEKKQEAIKNLSKNTSISEIEKLKKEFNDPKFTELADKQIEKINTAKTQSVNEKKRELIKKGFVDKLNNASLENIESLYDEIDTIEHLEQKDKDQLKKEYENRVAELSGGFVRSKDDILGAFTHTVEEDVELSTKQDGVEYQDIDPRDPKQDKKDVEEEVSKTSEELLKDQSTIVGQDSEGGLIYNYVRSTIGAIRAAFLSRNFNQKTIMNEVSREEITNDVQNLHLLDPDTLKEGTKISLEVKTDFSNYVENETLAPWASEWLTRLEQIKTAHGENYRQSPEYIAEVPIIATNKENQELFYLHNMRWINEENLDLTEEELKVERAKLFEMRRYIVAMGNTESSITFRGNGHLMKTADGNNISLGEAMPDSNLSLAVAKDGLKGNKSFRSQKNVAEKDLQKGRLYAVVPIGGNNVPLPLTRKELNEETIETIMQAVKAWLTKDSNNPVVQKIADVTGIDITSTRGLERYLNNFIYLTKTDGIAGLEPFLNKTPDGTVVKSSHKLIGVTGNSLQFGKPGTNMGRKVKGGQERVAEISPNFPENAAMLANFETFLKGVLSNADVDSLKEDGNIVLFDSEGTPSTVKYDSFLKETHETNILGINIGTEEKPKYVYTIQPTILIDDSFINVKNIKTKISPKIEKQLLSVIDISEEKYNVSFKGLVTVKEELLEDIHDKENTVDVNSLEYNAEEAFEQIFQSYVEKDPNFFSYFSRYYVKKTENLSRKEEIELFKSFTHSGQLYNTFGGTRGNSEKLYQIIQESLKVYNKILEENIFVLGQAKETIPNSLYISLESIPSPQLKKGQIAEKVYNNILSKIQNTTESNIVNVLSYNEFKLYKRWKDQFPTINDNITYSIEEEVSQELEEIDINGETFGIPNEDVIEYDEDILKEDSNEMSDKEWDEAPIPLDKETISRIDKENSEMLIKGISPRTQDSLVSYLASKVTLASIEAEKKNKKKADVNIKEVLEQEKQTLLKIKQAHTSKGNENNAKRIDSILEQWEKVSRLTKEHLALYTTGSIHGDIDEDSTDGGQEKIYVDDWTFTISSKNTASADLKKFFSYIPSVDAEGKPIYNILGLPEITPFDEVYDTVHQILANKVADYKTMMEHLRIAKDVFPWLESVINNLEESSDKIKNEFVSDMTKHYINMKFVMWSKDSNGNYMVQLWESDNTSKQKMLISSWNNNLKSADKQSNLVTLNEKDEYVFNESVVDTITATAKEWSKNPLGKTEEDITKLATYLGHFGIVLSNKTYSDLVKGRLKNKKLLSWQQIFTADNGPVQILATQLEKKKTLTIDDAELLKDTIVKCLAELESKNVSNIFSNSYQAGVKTIYSYSNNKYITNRVRDLAQTDSEGNLVDRKTIDDLLSIAFTKSSVWLNNLVDETDLGELMRNTLGVNYVSLEALKKQNSQSKDNRKLNNMSDAEHEVIKLGMFFNSSKNDTSDGTRRVVEYFYPTMSDKSTMITIRSLAKVIKQNEDKSLSQENLKDLYTAIVEPEILRITTPKAKNVKGYEPSYFYFLPSLNTEEVTIGDKTKTIREWVIDGRATDEEVKSAIMSQVEAIYNKVVDDKLKSWEKLGIGKVSGNSIALIDKSYLGEVARGIGKDKVRFAAMDFVFNSMIANAEMYKIGPGDPAQYFKKSSVKDATIIDHLEETFINLGKRLAGEIAPGMELADSQNNEYIQVFFADQEIDSLNVQNEERKAYFKKIIPNFDDKKAYSNIEGSDAQEYTTWEEHLYVMKQTGKLTETQYNELRSKLNKGQELSYEELGTILQPMKPVYNGNIADPGNNIDRKIYIKSSSFPLIPQLTAGMELDKVRKVLEDYEKKSGKTVRASFGTANKVGAVNAMEIFNEDGTIKNDLSIADDNVLTLKRSNFRIQQEVPYKREKDEVNIGTQERKLLFVNMLDVEIEKGVTGEDLQKVYDNAYANLFQYKYEKLMDRLGLVDTVATGNVNQLYEVNTENSIFDKLKERDEQLSKASNVISKSKVRQEFEKQEGSFNVKRADYITENFDKIVQAFAEAKVNIFFEEGKEEFKKDCKE
jgi:hypothetical protein